MSFEQIETAMCLWEAVQDGLRRDDPLFKALIEEGGTCAARHTVASWIAECDSAWEASEQVDCFDWDFVPVFLRSKLEAHYPSLVGGER
jgi:hypothetical protein